MRAEGVAPSAAASTREWFSCHLLSSRMLTADAELCLLAGVATPPARGGCVGADGGPRAGAGRGRHAGREPGLRGRGPRPPPPGPGDPGSATGRHGAAGCAIVLRQPRFGFLLCCVHREPLRALQFRWHALCHPVRRVFYRHMVQKRTTWPAIGALCAGTSVCSGCARAMLLVRLRVRVHACVVRVSACAHMCACARGRVHMCTTVGLCVYVCERVLMVVHVFNCVRTSTC